MYKLLVDRLADKASVLATNDESLVTFINPYTYFMLRNRQETLQYISKIAIDGILFVQILKLLGVKNVERISFDYSSIAGEVFDSAVRHKKSVYILGSDTESVNSFVTVIKSRHPGINICGVRHGYFDDSNEFDEVVKQIVILSPDILVCGMGAGLQEHVLAMLRESGWSGQGYTCGGFIHQTAICGGKYYPDWVTKFHLRFLYRIFREPKTLKRYMFVYPRALVLFLYDYAQYVLSKKMMDASQ